MSNSSNEYVHTQRAPLHYLLYGVAALVLSLTWMGGEPAGRTIGICVALLVSFFSLCFEYLEVTDAGDRLKIRYGPIRLFRKTIPYESIQSAEPGRSAIIDGWGIHYVIGRGWTYNLWGRECVVMQINGGVLRVGTDDANNLAAFLTRKIGLAATPA